MCLVGYFYVCSISYLTHHRLILYYPVSALVTLFGNILQNPQDPRARSDVRLMNLVVNFLSMLVTEEENGGVKRMLGVCSEFERIAKVVLDKAEKDSSSRRKRKNHDDINKTKSHQQHHGAPPNPQISHASMMAGIFSPNMGAQAPPNGFGSSPMNNQMNGSPGSGTWQADYGNGSEFMTPNANGMTPFADYQNYPNGGNGGGSVNDVNSPMNMNTFQQPFVPQDLWQMPMTLEWDWANMTGGQYPSFENGIMGDPTLQHSNNQHLQNRPM